MSSLTFTPRVLTFMAINAGVMPPDTRLRLASDAAQALGFDSEKDFDVELSAGEATAACIIRMLDDGEIPVDYRGFLSACDDFDSENTDA